MARMLQGSVTLVLLEGTAIDKMGTDPIPAHGLGEETYQNSWIGRE